MFECLRRRHRHLRTWVLGLFAALWLVALSSAAPTRMALPLLANGGQASFSMAEMGFCGMPPQADEWAAWLGEDPGADPPSTPSAHSPACLLCIALATPGSAHQRLPPALAGGLAPAGQPRRSTPGLARPGPPASAGATAAARLKFLR